MSPYLLHQENLVAEKHTCYMPGMGLQQLASKAFNDVDLSDSYSKEEDQSSEQESPFVNAQGQREPVLASSSMCTGNRFEAGSNLPSQQSSFGAGVGSNLPSQQSPFGAGVGSNLPSQQSPFGAISLLQLPGSQLLVL